MAPFLFLGTLLLSGCTPANAKTVAGIGRNALEAMVTAAAPATALQEPAQTAPAADSAIDTQESSATPGPVAETPLPSPVPVSMIPLTDPLNTPTAELSGLAWHGEQLILLPQYPSRFGGSVFSLDKAEIGAFLRGESAGPLAPQPIAFDDGALYSLVDGFEGFEAITFDGDRAYLTVESRTPFGMLGILVSGQMGMDGALLSIDPFTQRSIPAQAGLTNMTDEAVTRLGDLLITLYEANGANVNPQPQAHLFDGSLTPLGAVPAPTIEYRVTDATDVDEAGRFWVINYMWPGDANKLVPAPDNLARPPDSSEQVERLVEFQLSDEGIVPSGTPPIYLQLLPGGISRNWEGVVRYQDGELDGFLLVTDEFPTTMLGFVPRPAE